MRARDRLRFATTMIALIAGALIGAATPGCGGDALVELRLYPCNFGPSGAETPSSVRVVIDSFDASGAAVETGLSETFPIEDASVFADGFATVGYKRSSSVATATFTVVWISGSGAAEQEVVHKDVAVPEAGGSIDLLSEGQCADTGDTDTSTSDTTGSTSDDTTTSATTSEGTSSTSSSATTDATSDTSAMTDTATTTAGTDTATGSETETDTGEELMEPIVGAVCDPQGPFGTNEFCWTDGYGAIGTIYRCVNMNNTHRWVNYTDTVCNGCPGSAAGCSGNGGVFDEPAPYDCLCAEQDQGFCAGPVSACSVDMGVFPLAFCQGDTKFTAFCLDSCMTDPDDDTKPVCGPNPYPYQQP